MSFVGLTSSDELLKQEKCICKLDRSQKDAILFTLKKHTSAVNFLRGPYDLSLATL